MVAPKRILVICGTAIANFTVVAIAIEKALKERGIDITTRLCNVSEVRFLASDADLIVTTTPAPENLGIPVIHTLAFLTGIGKQDAIDQIVDALEK